MQIWPSAAGREHLAEQAAAGLLAGRTAAAAASRLRLVTTAELLCPGPPPPLGAELSAEAAALSAAALAALRRREGWLTLFQEGGPLPVQASGRLFEAAALCFLRCALLQGAKGASLALFREGAFALVRLNGARCAETDAGALLRRLACQSGGTAFFLAKGHGAALLRLPLWPGPLRSAPKPEAMLGDRFSLLHLYLAGFCAEPDA